MNPDTVNSETVNPAATRAEVAVTACADLFAGDGEILASPMGLVPSIGARLARLTVEPDLLLNDGEACLLADTPPLGVEASIVEGWLPFRSVLETVVPHGRRHVVMGANQVDRFGNQNISAIGEHSQPKKQLLGVRGSPGNSVNHRTSYWVPRHSRRVFVERVDIVAGVGYDNATSPAAARFHDVHRVVSNLGVFDFATPDHSMRLVSLHPGVTLEEVAEATSFDLVTDGYTVTREPTARERHLIRDVLDPKSTRDKEVR